MGELLERRRALTRKRSEDLRSRLVNAETLCGDVACVYVTGSFGRGEASQHSDLDLFIAGGGKDQKSRSLSPLAEIQIKAALITATQELGFPPFSGGGQYLQHHAVGELTGTLGEPEDDVKNTFTARLLWVLESRPLLGTAVYQKLTKDVIEAYWGDFDEHRGDFMPAFLANDILRMWRTFCVNYEARTSREPDEERAKRKLKNYKLKHSRLMTCYSGLLYLLAIYAQKRTVGLEDALAMVALTPTERIEWLARQREFAASGERIRELLSCYESFLQRTDAAEKELIQVFLDADKAREYFQSTNKFGDLMFEVLDSVGNNNRLYRILLV